LEILCQKSSWIKETSRAFPNDKSRKFVYALNVIEVLGDPVKDIGNAEGVWAIC
jgi:hypothetical protein